MKTIVYKSKVDSWTRIMFSMSGLISTVFSIAIIWIAPPVIWMISLFITCVAFGLPLWILKRTNYEFAQNSLIIRSGPFRWTILLDNIKDATPTNSPLSAPALSLDRLNIIYGDNKSIMISPENKEEFIGELNRRSAQIEKIKPK